MGVLDKRDKGKEGKGRVNVMGNFGRGVRNPFKTVKGPVGRAGSGPSTARSPFRERFEREHRLGQETPLEEAPRVLDAEHLDGALRPAGQRPQRLAGGPDSGGNRPDSGGNRPPRRWDEDLPPEE